MEKINYKEARKEFNNFLVKYTGCKIQEGCPCGTCIINLLVKLGIKEDEQHNKGRDRINEVWRAILQIREKEERQRK